MTRHSVTVGNDRFIVGPWHVDERVAYLGLAPATRALTSRASVEQCLDRLLDLGYHSVVTAALRAGDAHVFHLAGFSVHERLHVLRHDLDGLDALRESVGDDGYGIELRRARRRDRPAVLEVDRRAFDPFWALGGDGLDEALTATSTVRFRAAEHGERVVGYAVCGRSLDVGYLQRLAVHPDHARHGIGARLVLDALTWLRRRRGRSMLVNTQESNTSAVALYRRLGFTLEREQLTVLSWGR